MGCQSRSVATLRRSLVRVRLRWSGETCQTLRMRSVGRTVEVHILRSHIGVLTVDPLGTSSRPFGRLGTFPRISPYSVVGAYEAQTVGTRSARPFLSGAMVSLELLGTTCAAIPFVTL